MKTFVASKIHNIHVTHKSVEYVGSIGVDSALLEESGIDPYEQVHVINLHNGERWVTYAIPADKGVFSLNGGSARLGELGDPCVILTYEQTPKFSGAVVVYCTEQNDIEHLLRYTSQVTQSPEGDKLVPGSEESRR